MVRSYGERPVGMFQLPPQIDVPTKEGTSPVQHAHERPNGLRDSTCKDASLHA